jgi:PLP dependent protein
MMQQSANAEARLASVLDAVAAAAARVGRPAHEITLVAVSKHQPASAVATLADVGQVHFGENYVQEALAKQEELSRRPLQWHFIGRLQSNKAKHACGRFSLIHTVDSLKLAQTLHKFAHNVGVVQSILLQVNIGCEEQKAGIAFEELEKLALGCLACSGLRLQGLMCMPPLCTDPEDVRPYFKQLRQLRDSLEQRLGMALPHLSMGMSADFEQAVEEGATLIRVGTALFGPRMLTQR